MSELSSCAYTGTVVHKRLAPKPHEFAYNVFSLCLDVDEIDRLDCELRFFSRNRWNLVSFQDRDFADGAAERIDSHVRRVLSDAGLAAFGQRILLLCYPRILGYVFNPISVYFCYGTDARLGAIIYEVSNTFAERKSYVIPVDCSDGRVIAQGCAKELYVSPFTSATGRYGFQVLAPGDQVVIGVDFIGADGPVLKTQFRGVRLALSDRAILALLVRYPLMTLKVVTGIHLEAARLWLKGVPLVQRHTSPRYSATIVKSSTRDRTHAQQ